MRNARCGGIPARYMQQKMSLEAWAPPLARMPFIAGRQACIDAVELWLMGNKESSSIAVLGCTAEAWAKWKADESFNFLVACLTEPVRGMVHGQYTRMTRKMLDELERQLDEGKIPVKTQVALLSVLSANQGEIEKRAKQIDDKVPEKVAELWKRLEHWSKSNPVKAPEVIEGEVSAA